jgi:hypothetical protein
MPDDDEADQLTPAERELESALARLTPVPPRGLTASQIETRALVARERRRTRAWQAVAAALAVGATAALWLRPTPVPQVVEVERVVVREVERPRTDARWTLNDVAPAAPPPTTAGDFAYLHLRQRVLARGVEALPAPRATPTRGRPVPQAMSRAAAAAAADRPNLTTGDRS